MMQKVKTHAGGSRKWSLSSYQVEDDLHGVETHAHGLDWNFAWSICLWVSLETTTAGGEGKSATLG